MKKWFLLSLGIFGILRADVAFESRQAASLMQAGQFDQALSLYQRLLDQVPNAWQKAIIQTNIGMIYVKEGLWMQAIEAFEQVHLTANLPPPLWKTLFTNKALAFYGHAKQLREQENPQYSEIFLFVQEAIQNISFAEQIECKLAEASSTECALSPELVHLKTLIESFRRDVKTKLLIALMQELTGFWIAQGRHPETSLPSPMSILSQAIALQTFAKNLHLLMTLSHASALQTGVVAIQQSVLGTADAFLQQVLKTQALDYAQGHCQNVPWDRALALFFDGKRAAKQAAFGLQAHAAHRFVTAEQTRAQSLWESALKELTTPQHTTPETAPMPPQQLNQPQPFEETIRLLQRMETEDRPAHLPGKPPTEVLRPW